MVLSLRDDYSTPRISDLGTLKHLTQQSPDGGLHFHQAALGSLDSGQVPDTSTGTTPTQEVSDNQTSGGSDTPGGGNGVDDVNDSGGNAGTPAGGVGSGVGGVGPDELPFTGLEVGPVALVGAGLATAGAALRRIARRP